MCGDCPQTGPQIRTMQIGNSSPFVTTGKWSSAMESGKGFLKSKSQQLCDDAWKKTQTIESGELRSIAGKLCMKRSLSLGLGV